MATVNPTWTICPLPWDASYGAGAAGVHGYIEAPWPLVRITWVDVDGGDTCTATPAGWLIDKSVQISGTTVTSVAIQGSNDNVEFKVLNDPQGNALTGVSSEVIEQILENVWMIQPVVTTGTDVDITLFGRVPIA